MGLLQIAWFISPRPSHLSIWLMVLGSEMLIASGLMRAVSRNGRNSRVLVGAGFLSVGYLFMALAVMSNFFNAFAVYLFLLFRSVEGAAAARFYRTVAYVLRSRTLPGGTRFGSRVKLFLAPFFVIVVGVGVLLSLLRTFGLGGTPVIEIYTPTMVGVTSLSVWWRVRSLRQEYAIATLLGFTTCITGAEIYGFATVATEITVSLSGFVAFGVGFWLLIALWMTNVVSHSGFKIP